MKCKICNGDGFTSEHDEDSRDHEGQHCCSGCPIQVQCENCQATGQVGDMKATMLNFFQEIGEFEKLHELREQHMQCGYIYTWHPHDNRWSLRYDYSEDLKTAAITVELEGKELILKE